MRHATTRRRHRARSSRGWFAAVAAALAAVVIVTWISRPPGTDPARRADARAAAGASPSAGGPRAAAPEMGGTGTASAQAGSGAGARGGLAKAAPDGTPSAARPARAPAAPAAAQPPVPAGRREITVVNRTQQVLWAVVTGSPVSPHGRRLAPGQGFSLTVGNTWGGRIWGRTGCSGDAAGRCLTGDCTTVCGGPTTPTTLGEFTFDAFDGMDFYDVSMVDGSNLPMYVNISHTATTDPVTASGCYKGACTRPVSCPSAMQARNGGRVIGCEPPCAAFGGDTYCCRGAWAGREACVPAKWPVDYTQVFKKAEPYAYAYAFDDSATMACKGACFYRVTFGTSGGG